MISQLPLILRAQSGDRSAQSELLRLNHGIIRKLVWKTIRGRTLSSDTLDDLLQEAMLGYLKAVEKFNPARDLSLNTYAAWWIRARVGRFLSDTLPIVRVVDDARLHRQAPTQWRQKDPCRVNARKVHLSLDRPLGDDGGRTHGDMIMDTDIGPEDMLVERDWQRVSRAQIDEALKRLKVDERRIVEMRYLQESDLSQEEIAVQHGKSRGRGQQWESEGLRKLMKALGSNRTVNEFRESWAKLNQVRKVAA